jgi:hypothetical protein
MKWVQTFSQMGEKGEGKGSKWSSLVNGSVLLSKQNDPDHRKIRITEGNAECLIKKYLPVKGLCGRCLSV